MSPTSYFFIQEIIYVLILFVIIFLIKKEKFVLGSWSRKEILLTTIVIILSCLGAITIGLAVHGTNATYTSLIEISYPLFVILITFLIYQKVKLNRTMILGAIFIIIGIAVLLINPL